MNMSVEGRDQKLDTLTRAERLALLEDCVCPVCAERQVSFEELLACLMDHDDEGMDIANDYIPEARRLMVDEEADDILGSEYGEG